MNLKTFSAFLAFIIIVCVSMAFITGCAQQITPSGGPKDSLPPILLGAIPADSTRNFNTNKITFYFSEYVQLDNVHDNLIVSPTPKVEPIVDSKLRTVSIKIKDTLEANTTYVFNFGNAIKDINEGNVARNFTYLFSTGKSLDSLELRGSVLIAQTGKPDSTLIVMLHRNKDDSAVIKERPRYIAKLDSGGHFRFRNLPAGTFYLYALKDEGGQKKYLSKKQFFGFAERAIQIGTKNDPVNIYAYLEKDTFKAVSLATAPVPVSKKDKGKEQDKRLKFGNNLSNGFQDLLGDLEFSFPDPLKNFDSSKARLTDGQFKPVTGYTFTKDSTGKLLTLRNKWQENSAYNLIVDKEFAEDSTGKKIARTDTLRFRTLKETDYGKLRIVFNNIDLSKKPVLQLMQGETMKLAEKLVSKEFNKILFKPGDYEIRILYDDNGNGVWDTGDFFSKHLQPEKVIAIKKPITVKANWDNETVVDL
jgi:uncharacterized protein (DUF2141 family)